MKLVSPSAKYKQSYLEAAGEFEYQEGSFPPPSPRENQTFEQFVKQKSDEPKGINLPEGIVPSTEFWLIDNEEFIGRGNIRHTLNDWLFRIGGHVGYWIRPTKRKMGYGKKILELILVEAKKMGFKKILVTCDVNNIGSKRVIEANGGVLENIVPNGDNPMKMRYWIIPHR